MPVSFKMVVIVKGLDQQNQRIRHLKKPATMIEKENIKAIARLQKKVDGIPEIHVPRRRMVKKK